MQGRRPRVFVSYAHDSVVHKESVLRLAQVLRGCGVEVHLDQESSGRRDWSLWALRHIQDADFVVVVASAAYKVRAEGLAAAGEGRGSQAEAAILRDKLTEDLANWTRKILPVVLPGNSVADIPGFLQPYAATHYLVGEITPAGISELLTAMSMRPPVTATRGPARRRRRLVVPVVAAVVAVAAVMVWAPWSGGDPVAEGAGLVESRRGTVTLVPESFACTSGVEDKIDLDTGQRGHGVQPQIPYSSCASEGGLADLIVDEGRLHTASENQDTILLVPRDETDLDGARCVVLIADGRLDHTLSLGDLRVGDRLCVRTDRGRVALVTLRRISAGSTVVIHYVVWERSVRQ